MRALLLTLALAATPATAQDVELELVLLADASGSIDQAEIDFQRQGYAAAITSDEVLGAIDNSAYGRIAVTYVEWAANTQQVAPWTVIDGPGTAQAFADALTGPPRLAYGRNAIGGALDDARRLIDTNDHEGWRKVIDFSGDSANNYSGPSIADARQAALDAGIVINALAITCPPPCSGRARPNLVEDYQRLIIGGPGAFVVSAEGRSDFAAAVRRKLVLEIGGLTPTTDLAEN